MQINATQVAGLLALVPAALSASIASLSPGAKQLRESTIWGAIGVVYALLAIEVVALTRYDLDRVTRDWLLKAGLYLDRRPAQIAILLTTLLLIGILARMVARLAPTWSLAVATCATAAVVLVFIADTVSFHDVDRALYQPAGPVLLIGWLWLACGWTTVAAAAARRS